MYIPYENIGNQLYKIFKSENLKDFFYNKKIEQNLFYIEKNHKKVLKKLKEKYKNNKKINVAFYVYDETKWKCQSLYELLENSDKFNVKVLVTRNSATNKDNPSYQTIKELRTTHEFFFKKGMNVEFAYDIKKEKHIPFKKFKPDIIVYQHPWYIETSQGPVVCSKFALTYYIPYYFPTTSTPIDYYLRFHQYIENYCVFDEITQNLYKEKMSNNGKNVIVTGQPFLDYFKLNKKISSEFIIYAPHWTICKKGIAYGTFEWNGEFLLNYAKSHPEQKWIFKPHPLLKKALIDNHVMTEQQAEDYYNEWDKIGLRYEHGDYLELFNKSKMLITDCSSFLGEYFLTENPVIHLISPDAKPYNETINQIIKYYYKANNIEELKTLLEHVPQNDFMKEERINALNRLGYKNTTASENILKHILEQIS